MSESLKMNEESSEGTATNSVTRSNLAGAAPERLGSRGILDPIVVTRLAQVKDHPAIDLILGLLCVEVFHLFEQPLNFVFEVARQIVCGKDRRRRVGHGKDGNDVVVAPAGMSSRPQRRQASRSGSAPSVVSVARMVWTRNWLRDRIDRGRLWIARQGPCEAAGSGGSLTALSRSTSDVCSCGPLSMRIARWPC